MAKPTCWTDKLVNNIISVRTNRREFLKATTAAGLSASAFGAIGVLSGYAGAQTTQDKNTDLQQQIYNFMWKRKDLSTSERVERLSEIFDKSINDKDPAITQAAAEGLMLFADDRVFKKLEEAHKKYSDNEPLQRYIVQLMNIHFILNPQARGNTIAFYFPDAWGNKPSKLDFQARYIGITYWGNFSFRLLRQRLRQARLSDSHGQELIWEHHYNEFIKRIYPRFNAFDRYPDKDALTRDFMNRRFGGWVDYAKLPKPSEFTKKTSEQARADQEAFGNPEEKIPGWKKQLVDESLPMDDRILALLNWDEIENLPQDPTNSALLTKMLDNETPEMKQAVMAIFGSSWEPSLPTAIHNRLVKYLLESSDLDMVLAAAKALRFRDDLPVDDILKTLEQNKDEKIRHQLGDILLSSLGSPKTFRHLVRSFIRTDPKNIEDKKRRADELRIWYLRFGDKGDDVVRQAIPSAPRNIQDMVIEWLQNISRIKFSDSARSKPLFTQGGPSYVANSTLESEINKDIESFVEIAKKLAGAENKVLTGASTISDF